ncbi:MAG TPA: LysR family transcriptional regulator [Pseudonocardiaceae bacterium]|nr:LysR family transcriptional regulator [Pseudonocardiaceae bacterium]
MTNQTDALRALTDALAPRLALLVALAEERNVTRAAARLGVPQPTVSRWLATLATELGTPVITRDGRGIRLTRAGEHLAEAAEEALAALALGYRRAEAEADPERGEVVLAFLHTMGELRIPELLRAFRAEHPAVRFTLVQGSKEDVLARLRTGSVDLALTSPPPEGPEFTAIELDRQELVVTVPSGHRLAGRGRIRIAELAKEQFVGMKAGFGLRQLTDELCAAAGFTPRHAFEGEEVDTVRGLVAAGLGVAILPSAEWVLPPNVVELSLRPKAGRGIGLAWITDRPLTPAVLSFRDFALRKAMRPIRQPTTPRT